jgi:transcriptional regulator with XRE-family HTH domain
MGAAAEQWRRGVPIGETLAQARHQAGLTLAQVSRQTRIRETIIRKIEADDFSECGGDFYSRGHIRAIAKAVGTDPEPLIQDYDSDHRATGPMATVSLDELLASSAPQRHRPDLPAAWARVTAASAPVARKASAGAGAARDRMTAGYGSAPRTARWAVVVCLALIVVALGFIALHVLAGAPPASPSAAGNHAATSHHDGHGQSGPAAKASQPAPSPAPKASHTAAPSAAPSQPAQSLSPVRATAYGPNGGDNPQLAHLVLRGGHAAGWHTDWYSSPRFGNLYPGTGLLLKMDQTVTITSATVNLGSATGASLQLRVGNTPTMAALQPVARASGAGGVVRLNPGSPARGRYVLVWFTRLPTDSSGTFRASVHGVTLHGHG